MNPFKKFIAVLLKITGWRRAFTPCSCHPSDKAGRRGNKCSRPCRSAEGWELVQAFEPGDSQRPAQQQAVAAAHTIAPAHAGKLHSSLPPYPVVWVYFTVNDYSELEALRFYRRYQVFGWNTRVIATLTNWQQLADHWMQQAGHPSNRPKPKSPPNDTHPGPDNCD